jgi:hypothetical protein
MRSFFYKRLLLLNEIEARLADETLKGETRYSLHVRQLYACVPIATGCLLITSFHPSVWVRVRGDVQE